MYCGGDDPLPDRASVRAPPRRTDARGWDRGRDDRAGRGQKPRCQPVRSPRSCGDRLSVRTGIVPRGGAAPGSGTGKKLVSCESGAGSVVAHLRRES